MRRVLSHSVARSAARRRGLTLIELVVVLTILVALGAILVPVVGNALTRSHLSTCLTNFPEVTKMLIQAEATRGTLGDGWTNPVDAPEFASRAGALTDDQIDALDDLMAPGGNATAGTGEAVFTSIVATTPGFNVTFENGVTPGGGAALTNTTDVVVLTAADAEGLYLPAAGANQQYVFFAIDKSWSLLGDLTSEPPVHFGDTEGALPHQVYSRWGAIFLVDSGDAIADNENGSAEFKRVTVHVGGAFETADNHSGVYWQEVHE